MIGGNPYEYFGDALGVQARFIFFGRNAHPESLQLISERALQHRVKAGTIVKLRPNSPTNPTLLKWDSISYAWQALIIKAFGNPPERVRSSIFVQHFTRDYKAFDFFTDYRFPDNSKIKEDSKIEEYTTNASVMNTIIEVYEKRRSYIKALRGRTGTAWEIVCKEASKFKDIEFHTLPDCPRSLRKIMKAYQAQGYAAMISGKSKNSNARKVTPEVELFINNLFADFVHKPNKKEVADQYDGFLKGYVEVINNETGEVYQPEEFPKLSVSTIYNYLSKWHNAIATYNIRGGDRQKLMGLFKPYHSLEQPRFAGSIISIDDRQPPFECKDGKRVWFYNGIDLGSEAFVCWVYGKAKEGIILDFYRQLVRNYAQWGLNIPAEIEAEASLNSSFVKTFLQEGNMFQYVRIEPNNARGKRIEAYYRPLRYKYEKKREGWLARPFARDEANQESPVNVPQIEYTQIVEGCLRDIETWNNTEHSKIKGKTRWEVFLQTQHPNIRPTNYRGIIPYLGYKTSTSCRAGIIKLQNQEYLLGNDGIIAVGTPLVELMTEVEGRNIDIYWLDDNFGNILKAYIYRGNQFICEAILKPTYVRARLERTEIDNYNYQLMSKYVATIEAYQRRRIQDIERVTIIDNTPQVLNNSFQIASISRYTPSQREPEQLPDFNTIPTDFNTPIIGANQNQRSSLKDRF